MSTELIDAPSDLAISEHESLEQAREIARQQGTPYAGSLSPIDAWELVLNDHAILVDVRTQEELKFVGRVPGAAHVAWQTGTALLKNPRFLRELEKAVGGKDTTVLLLCRSGKRSAAAAEAATKACFQSVFNVLEGFEGELDEIGQRGTIGGWRSHGLPWVQD